MLTENIGAVDVDKTESVRNPNYNMPEDTAQIGIVTPAYSNLRE